MTQQPFYPAGPQQPYPPQQAPQGYPQQYPPQQYPQQGYPAQAPMGYGAPQAPPAPPAQSGTLDDFYNQAVAAGGPGISWKDKAIGTGYAGIISGACTVQQDTDYTTKLPMFQRDGVTPKWVMLIPLSGVQTNHPGVAEFPDGEVVYYARGKDKEELNRAMAEAGCSGAPAAGATFQVTIVQRKPNRQGNPTNVVQMAYTPPNGQAHGPATQAAPAAVAEAPSPAAAPAPVQQFAPAPIQQAAAPEWAQQAPAPLAPMGAPVGVPQAVPAQGVAQAAPGPVPPAGMTPEAAGILAQLGVQQNQQG